MTTGKTIALTRRILVGNVMSLLLVLPDAKWMVTAAMKLKDAYSLEEKL